MGARRRRPWREMMAAEAAAAATLERMEALPSPPVLPGVRLGPAEALRLLCSPSDPRLRLLEWACARVYPPFAARLQTLQDGPTDARIRAVAELGARLLLCRCDDLRLVEGTAPPERQLRFLRDLLDAAPPPGDSGGAPPTRPPALRRNARLLRQVLGTPEGGAALSPPGPPPPPDFRHFDADGDPPTRPPRSPPPSLGGLEAALGGARRRLRELEEQNPELGVSRSPPPPVLAQVGVSGGDFSSLVAAFGAAELRDPRGAAPETPPRHGALGPPVREGLRTLGQSLGALAQLGDTAGEVTRLGGGPRHRALGTRVAALQRRFTPPE